MLQRTRKDSRLVLLSSSRPTGFWALMTRAGPKAIVGGSAFGGCGRLPVSRRSGRVGTIVTCCLGGASSTVLSVLLSVGLAGVPGATAPVLSIRSAAGGGVG